MQCVSNRCEDLFKRKKDFGVMGTPRGKLLVFSETKPFNCLPLFGPFGKQLDVKAEFAKTSGNPQKEFLQKSRTF